VGVDELVAAGAVRKNSLVKVLADGKSDPSRSTSPLTSSAAAAREKKSPPQAFRTEL